MVESRGFNSRRQGNGDLREFYRDESYPYGRYNQLNIGLMIRVDYICPTTGKEMSTHPEDWQFMVEGQLVQYTPERIEGPYVIVTLTFKLDPQYTGECPPSLEA
jgi:hypothetical protein